MERKTVTIPIYKGIFDICITSSHKDLNELYCNSRGKNHFEDDEIVYAHAMIAKLKNDVEGLRRYVMVLNFNNKVDKIDHGAIAHEALHITHFLLENKGIVLDYDNDEIVTYVLGWVVDEVYKFLKEINITI